MTASASPMRSCLLVHIGAAWKYTEFSTQQNSGKTKKYVYTKLLSSKTFFNIDKKCFLSAKSAEHSFLFKHICKKYMYMFYIYITYI